MSQVTGKAVKEAGRGSKRKAPSQGGGGAVGQEPKLPKTIKEKDDSKR
jgi:hypothetical protein